MGLKEIRDLAVAGADEAAQGHIATATNKFAQALVAISEIAMDMGFKAGPDDEALKAEIKTAFESAQACVSAKKAPKGADPAEFGKWGDGVFLSKLLEILLKFAPLFI
jgi:hypothetical protein